MACFCVSSRSVAFYFKDDRQLQIEFVLVDWNLYGKCKATSYSNIGERSELANGLTHEIINESPKREAFMAKVAEYVPFFFFCSNLIPHMLIYNIYDISTQTRAESGQFLPPNGHTFE